MTSKTSRPSVAARQTASWYRRNPLNPKPLLSSAPNPSTGVGALTPPRSPPSPPPPPPPRRLPPPPPLAPVVLLVPVPVPVPVLVLVSVLVLVLVLALVPLPVPPPTPPFTLPTTSLTYLSIPFKNSPSW